MGRYMHLEAEGKKWLNDHYDLFVLNSGLLRPFEADRDRSEKSVWLVDDENINQMMIGAVVVKGGYSNLTRFDNGKDVVRAYEKGLKTGDVPDIIIMDNSMPEMTGIEAIAKIRDLEFTKYGCHNSLIISCTADLDYMKNREGVLKRYAAAGADVYTRKPINSKGILYALGLTDSLKLKLDIDNFSTSIPSLEEKCDYR